LGKVRVLSGREVCRILAQNGFEEVRQRGSHIVMQGVLQAPPSRSQCRIIPNFGEAL